MKALLSKRAKRWLADPETRERLRIAIARKAFGKPGELVSVEVRDPETGQFQKYYLHSLTRKS